MPDVQEVFRLATQKIDPEEGFVERLRDHQLRRTRNRKLGALALAAVIGLVAVVVVIRAADDGTGTQPAVQPTPTPPAGTATETGYLIDLNTGEMTSLPKSIAGWGYTVSVDSNMVAYFSPDDAGRDQLFIASLDGTDVQQMTHGRRGAAAVDTMASHDLSPDGAAIVYGGPGHRDVYNIYLLDLATGETREVTNEKPPFEAHDPQFSPDGASIVYDLLGAEGDVSVWITPVTGGRSVMLVGSGKNDVEAITGTLSPDGSTLAVGCFGRLEGICLANADGSNLRVLVSDPSLDSGPSLVFPKWSPDGTRIAYIDQATTHRVFVVDVATGETTFVAEGFLSDWLDDHTLIVTPYCCGG